MPLTRELTQRTIQDIISQFTPRGDGDAPDTTNTRYRIAEHQRHYIWQLVLQITLIDSVMKNYPIPSVLLVRCIEGDMFYNIEDGQQRITTFYRYRHDLFEAMVNGESKKYSQLTEEEKMQFLTFQIQCDIYNSADLTMEDRIEIFQRTNSSKPLSDNQKFHSRLTSRQGKTLQWFLEHYSKQIHKYFGQIGKGKTRSGISDLFGALISLQRDDRSSLTTSYIKNSSYMDISREQESIVSFFDEYFSLLDEEVDSRTHKINKCYGKLSGPLGLALCSWIEYSEIHDALSWYIGKITDNRKYVPTSYRKLNAGDQRNCQGDSILKRLDKIIEQYNEDSDDEGDEDESDDE
jgi:hypothetical protein